MENEEKREPKTLFEHLGMGKGGGELKLPPWLHNTIKLVLIGFIVGLILDIMLDFNKLTFVVPLLMILFVIIKTFEKKETKNG